MRPGNFFGLNFGPGTFWVFIFAPIRSSDHPCYLLLRGGGGIRSRLGKVNPFLFKYRSSMDRQTERPTDRQIDESVGSLKSVLPSLCAVGNNKS